MEMEQSMLFDLAIRGEGTNYEKRLDQRNKRGSTGTQGTTGFIMSLIELIVMGRKCRREVS